MPYRAAAVLLVFPWRGAIPGTWRLAFPRALTAISFLPAGLTGSQEIPGASGASRAPRRRLAADAHRASRHSKTSTLALAEFATLRARLLKIAARITETASRVRIAFAAPCPEADLFRGIARSLQPAGP